MYPNNKQEFESLQRRDIKFDPNRVGKKGSPLRYPSNSHELEIADLPRIMLLYYFS